MNHDPNTVRPLTPIADLIAARSRDLRYTRPQHTTGLDPEVRRREKNEGVVMLNVRVSAALRKRIKMAAAAHQTTVQDIVTVALERWMLESER